MACGAVEPRPTLIFAAALLPAEQAKYQPILKRFTETTGIRVRMVSQQYDQVRNALEAEAQAGRGKLDVVELDLYQLPLMAALMSPLDNLMQQDGSLATAVAGDAWKVGLIDSTLFYVPHRLNWQALVYDAATLGQPPATWDEWLAIAAAHPGKFAIKGARYEGLACDVFPLVWQAGGDPLQADSPEAAVALNFLKSLAGYFNPSTRTYKENTILQAQEHGEILMHANWPFVVPLLKEKGLLPARLRTAPLPAGPAGAATVLGGGYLGIPKTAPHARLAGQLLDYLTAAETQQAFARTLGWLPIRAEGWEGLTADDRNLLHGYLAMQQAVRARPNVPYYEAVSEAWQDGIYRLLYEGIATAQVQREIQERIDQARELAAAGAATKAVRP